MTEEVKETTAGAAPAAAVEATPAAAAPKLELPDDAEAPVKNLTEDEKKTMCSVADKAFEEAKAAMEAQDYEKAADLLSTCLENKSAVHGELSPECTEAYIQYGRALLLSVKAANSLKGVLAKGKEKEKEKEKKEGDEDSEGEDDEDDEDEDGDDNIADTLETAWNVLETARAITEKQDPNSMRLSDVLMATAEVSLESDNLKEALGDIARALTLRKALCKPDDRSLAEVYFTIATVLSTISGSEQKSRENYLLAKGVLEARIANIEAAIDKHQAAPAAKVDDERKELRELIEEIDARVAELSTTATEPQVAPGMIREMLLASAPAPAAPKTSTTAVINLGVVGHTSRPPTAAAEDKKRALEEEKAPAAASTQEEHPPAKVPKPN